MYAEAQMQEYLDEIRQQVCSRCVERPPGGPPCAPLGKTCGVEVHLPLYVEAVHRVTSDWIEPYLNNIHESVCSQCVQHNAKGCPCPLDYLPILIVQAIETVDQRRRQDPGASAELLRNGKVSTGCLIAVQCAELAHTERIRHTFEHQACENRLI